MIVRATFLSWDVVQSPASLDALRANAEAFRALAQGIEADFQATRDRVEALLGAEVAS
jgi:hypothetical protein